MQEVSLPGNVSMPNWSHRVPSNLEALTRSLHSVSVFSSQAFPVTKTEVKELRRYWLSSPWTTQSKASSKFHSRPECGAMMALTPTEELSV